LAGPSELIFRDALLRIDRELARQIKGVYRRAESYLRLFQKISALLFATWLGRIITKYVLLPFGGAFMLVEFVKHMVEIVMGWLRGGPIPAGPLPEHRRAAAWFSGLTEAQRRDWLQLFYTDFARCGLTVNHFADTTPPSGPATLATHDVYPVNPSPGNVSAR